MQPEQRLAGNAVTLPAVPSLIDNSINFVHAYADKDTLNYDCDYVRLLQEFPIGRMHEAWICTD